MFGESQGLLGSFFNSTSSTFFELPSSEFDSINLAFRFGLVWLFTDPFSRGLSGLSSCEFKVPPLPVDFLEDFKLVICLFGNLGDLGDR